MLSRREIQDTHSFPINPKNLAKFYQCLIDAVIESEVRLTYREEKQAGLQITVCVKVTGHRWQLNQFAVKMAGAPYDTFLTNYMSSYYD